MDGESNTRCGDAKISAPDRRGQCGYEAPALAEDVADGMGRIVRRDGSPNPGEDRSQGRTPIARTFPAHRRKLAAAARGRRTVSVYSASLARQVPAMI